MEPAAEVVARLAAIQRIRRLTRVLDTRWRLPGTNWRFGLDPLLGLIPGLGDVLTLVVSIYMLSEAKRLGVGGGLMLAMIGNVALDFLVGEIPIVGDLFDFAFKSHVRNLSMLEKWLAREAGAANTPTDGVVPVKV
jgi:hypothetical protein